MNELSADVSRSKDVLLVESDPADADRVIEATDERRATFHVVPDSDGALDFLYRRGEYADAPRPDLVLLEASMADGGTDGILSTIKGDDALKRLPVILIADSATEAEIRQSYQLKANAFLQKPDDPGEFERVIGIFERFWLSLVQLPPKG